MKSLYGSFVRNFMFPLNQIREGINILEPLELFEESQYWPEARIREWQWERIKLLLNHAYENTAYYRKCFDATGIHPSDIKDFSDYLKVPMLHKKDLKNHLKELVASNFKPNEIHESTTGGTTADYTIFYRDNESLNYKTAATIRHDRWCGWDIGEKEAIVWPASIDFRGVSNLKTNLRNLLLDRKLRINAGVLNEEILHDISDKLHRFKPILIRGFVSPLLVLAEFLQNNRQYQIKPQAIKSVGEPLGDNARKLFEEVFQCKVFNYYLSRESATIASECEKHKDMHINAECLYIEYLREEKPVKYGEPGEIVVTDLYNLGMPFIRYQIGDMGIPIDNVCPCGRKLPMMAMSAGRESDFLISPLDGSYIMGLSLLVPFVENPKVGQLQIIQDKHDHIIMKIVKNTEFNEESLDLFKNTLRNMFKDKMSCTYEFVDTIPHDRSGKYRFIIRQEFKDE